MAPLNHPFWASYKKSTKKNEDRLDPVNKDAVKKDFDDRKDKDIDNDGDVDSTDKYLHKRRKAISKAVAKEGLEDSPNPVLTVGIYVQRMLCTKNGVMVNVFPQCTLTLMKKVTLLGTMSCLNMVLKGVLIFLNSLSRNQRNIMHAAYHGNG